MPDPRGKATGDARRSESSDVPLLIGLVLSAVLGAGLFGYGLYSYFGDLPRPFSTALVITGFLAMILSWFTHQRSRVAWSFLLSIDGTATVVFLFGASKIRDAFDVVLALGLLPSVLFGIATALVATSQNFRN